MLLEFVPVDPEPRWRAYQWLSHTATGTLVAIAARRSRRL